MTIQNSADHRAPRALYEYRGNRPEQPLQPAPVAFAVSASTRPLCAACSSAADRVVGGWWCSSCESAA